MNATEARSQAQRTQMTLEESLQRLEQLERELKAVKQDNKRLKAENERLKQRLAQYEPEPGASSDQPKGSPAVDYSVGGEERRRKKKRKRKPSPGRRPTAEKFAEAEIFQDIFPDGVSAEQARLVRERAVWRVIDSRLTLVGYRIFAGPDGKEPPIPGVPPRCEFGIEVLVTLGQLKYVIGLSLDKACQVMQFFWQRPLSKSQADALLRQLARHWESQFETLCDLLAHAAVVGMDETGWKEAARGLSAWVFFSPLHQVHLFGCRKDGATLETILPKDVFCGVGVSDNAAIYGSFTSAQKCWAHLLRKAIRLTRLYPENELYQSFLDSLLGLYYDAKRAAADGRLGEAGRRRKIDQFDERLVALVGGHIDQDTKGLSPHERAFVNLCRELFELGLNCELFTFVLHPEAPGTNNESERELRDTAADREAGRNTRTPAGSRRRTIIVSVLKSLRRNLETFTLSAVLTEVTRWMTEGTSLFQKQWKALVEQRSETAGTSMDHESASPSRLDHLFGAAR